MDKSDRQTQLRQVVIVFVVLTVVGVGMVVLAQNILVEYERQLLIGLGSAIFGGSLAFFLIEAFRYNRRG